MAVYDPYDLKPIGTLRNDNLNPRITTRGLGETTQLSVTVGRERVVDHRFWWQLWRDPAPAGPHPDGFIVSNGKLYRATWEEVWARDLGPDAKVDVLWQYGTLSGTVATNVATDGRLNLTLPWVIPTNLHEGSYAAAEFGVQFSVRLVPSGVVWGPEPLGHNNMPKLPDDVVPVFTSWNFSEGNPGIAEGAPFVPSSVLKAFPLFEGTLGAPMQKVETWFNPTIITSPLPGQSALRGGTLIPPEGLPLAAPGTYTIGARGTDTRGRWKEATTTITVAEYTRPVLTWTTERANTAGVPDSAGKRINVTVNTSVSFLGGANLQQIRIHTRPYGGSTWELASTIDPPAVTYTGTVLLPDTYDTNQSWEVLVELQDAVTVLSDVKVVPSEGVILDADRGHVAIGMPVKMDGPRTQLRGPARVYGDLRADNLPIRRQVGVASSGMTVPLLGFTEVPEVRLTPVANTTAATSAWLSTLTRNEMVVRATNNASVRYVAEQYAWQPPEPVVVTEPTELGTAMSGVTVIFVGKYIDSATQQFALSGDNGYSASLKSGAPDYWQFSGSWQLEGGVFVAWAYRSGAAVKGIGQFAGSNSRPWAGEFIAEMYPGTVPNENAQEITQRLANELGVAVTLGPQFNP